MTEVMTTSGLRILASVLRYQGNNGAADTLNLALDTYGAGKNVDSYMTEIAEKIEDNQLLGWEELRERLDAEVDDFLATDPAPE